MPLPAPDYAAARDPALEAALAYEPRRPLQERLAAAARAGGAPAVRREVAACRADPSNRYQHLDLLLPRAAEALYSAGRREEAFAAAEVAAEAFPQSVAAWNVLAFVAEGTKRPEVALKAGRMVLELDPDNRAARSLVERLAPPRP